MTREADRNMVVEGQRTGMKINPELVTLSITLLSVVVSFFVGFLLEEDTLGGARFDFDKFIGR